ncbi:hypothetical protein QFZ22_000105 [Streptomyces canus]|uniref:Uncharacterized protein n=1 Tax=Streptomyces canus TaxID=58343 RepID=A0AAW8F4D8_9ACTN|nr:hypothetical protein [Streptomyces canus]MDQ0904120.1 hypothetical protein [Streptomyces canus]
MNVTRRPAASLATESFDRETIALLDAIEVELPEFGDIDMDVAFGTPLELHEPYATSREKGLTGPELLKQFFARRHAARDILADDPAVTALVRERLVDVLLPYASQLNPANSKVSAFHGTVTAAPLAA